MKRKINRVGASTLTVSLPSKWAREHGLKQGDELEVGEEGAVLTIATEKILKPVPKMHVKLHGPWKLKRRYIYNTYKLGCDEVRVTFEEPNDLKLVQEFVNSLIGFEIVEQGKDSCLIKSVAIPSDDEFEVILRKFFLLLLSMSEDTYDSFKTKTYDHFDAIAVQDLAINKTNLFLSRILIKKNYNQKLYPIFLYLIIHQIEKLGDLYRDICLYYVSKKVPLGGNTLHFFKSVNVLLRKYYEFFYDFTPERAEWIYNEVKKLEKEGSELFSKAKKDEAYVIHSLLTTNRIIYDLCSPVFGLYQR